MEVPFGLDLLTRLVHDFPSLWREAGRLESGLLARKLATISVDRPIFIGGLARSGSTILLEYLATHPEVTTHQYRDFPFIFTPYFSRRLTSLLPTADHVRERAHGDRIMISPRSPEAMEEMLWRAFKRHDEGFSVFYRDHIKKLILASGGTRYAAKNNHLAAHLPTLLKLFPNARIIIPLRDPVAHIASLMRQHQRFCASANHPRAIRQLAAQGHDEFGPLRHWHANDEITGWIAEWNRTYAAVLPYLGRENLMVVPYEALCGDPVSWLERITHHSMLEVDATRTHHFACGIKSPDYYETPLSDADQAEIRQATHEININFTNSMVS